MKKLVKSKWSKRFLWLCIFLPFSIWGYILLFIGTANTYIDNVCCAICLISMATLIIRSFIIECWQYDGN